MADEVQPKQLTRRDFLKGAAFLAANAAAGPLLAACAPAPTTDRDSATAVTPANKPSRVPYPDREDLIKYEARLYRIFDQAYPPNNERAGQSVKQKLSEEFYFAAQEKNPVSEAIWRKVNEIINDELSPQDKMAVGRGPKDPNSYQWWWFMEATKRVYREKGFAVLNIAESSDGIPKLAIYDLPEGKKRTIYKAKAHGAEIGSVEFHQIDKNATVVFDSTDLLTNWQRPDEIALKDGQEIWVFTDILKKDLDIFKRVARGETLNKPEQNPPANDTGAANIRETVKKIWQPVSSDFDRIYDAIIEEHSVTHIITKPTPPTPVSDEERSYVAELVSTTPHVARVALGEFLFLLTRSDVMGQTQNDKKISDNPTIGGIQATMIDFMEALHSNTDILGKFGTIPPTIKRQRSSNDPVNKYLPSSTDTNEYTEFILSRLNILETVDINKIAQRIVEMHKKDWLP